MKCERHRLSLLSL